MFLNYPQPLQVWLVSIGEFKGGNVCSLDLNSVFIEMSSVDPFGAEVGTREPVKSKIVGCSVNLLLVEQLSFRNQKPERSNVRS